MVRNKERERERERDYPSLWSMTLSIGSLREIRCCAFIRPPNNTKLQLYTIHLWSRSHLQIFGHLTLFSSDTETCQTPRAFGPTWLFPHWFKSKQPEIGLSDNQHALCGIRLFPFRIHLPSVHIHKVLISPLRLNDTKTSKRAQIWPCDTVVSSLHVAFNWSRASVQSHGSEKAWFFFPFAFTQRAIHYRPEYLRER